MLNLILLSSRTNNLNFPRVSYCRTRFIASRRLTYNSTLYCIGLISSNELFSLNTLYSPPLLLPALQRETSRRIQIDVIYFVGGP